LLTIVDTHFGLAACTFNSLHNPITPQQQNQPPATDHLEKRREKRRTERTERTERNKEEPSGDCITSIDIVLGKIIGTINAGQQNVAGCYED
jgi:hypothetical protein